MAVASYFDRIALGASALIQGFDLAAFKAVLDAETVGIGFDAAGVSSPEGICTLDLSCNLIARMYPRLVLLPQDAAAEVHAQRLALDARATNVNIDVHVLPPGAPPPKGRYLVVGSTRLPSPAESIYIGADRWVALASTTSPMPVGASQNAFGAAAAACIGAAMVFRRIFLESAQPLVDFNLRLSVLDPSPSASILLNPPDESLDLGELYLIGAGAIGNGFLWALARTAGISGTLHVVDGETCVAHNAQRYVLMRESDSDLAKTQLALREFAAGRNMVSPQLHPLRWGEFLSSLPEFPRLDRLAVAVDTAKDRIGIQASQPRRVFNAWTQVGDLGVSRHGRDSGACLACLYLPREKTKSLSHLVAEAIGLPAEEPLVRLLLFNGQGVPVHLLERVAAALNVPADELRQFAGQPLINFYSEAVCGGLMLRLGATSQTPTQVPMAFQSALAGVLLASAVAADALGVGPRQGTKTVLDITRPLQGDSLVPIGIAGPNCICQDADFTSMRKP